MTEKVYVVLLHKKGGISGYVGVYATRELAEKICNIYNINKHYKARGEWADFFSDEVSTEIV